MKHMHVIALTIISSISLSSCQAQKQQQIDDATQETRTPLSGNLFYLEQLITKAEKPQTVFDGIIADNRLVLVDFFAEWCPPCKRMSPEIDKVAKQFPSVIFLKVNTELFPELSQSIKSIPVIRIYKDGNRVYNEAGGKSESQLKQLITQFQK